MGRRISLPLGHLLKNEEALLDDVDVVHLANELVLLLDKDLLELIPVPVINTIEMIETLQGIISTPTIERMVGRDMNRDMHRSMNGCVVL